VDLPFSQEGCHRRTGEGLPERSDGDVGRNETRNSVGAIMTRTVAGFSDFLHQLLRLHREDSGQDLIEYALIAALIALSAVAGMGSVAKAINDIFSSVSEKIKAYVV
jgi:pilus assembly protein Flp/PilA